MSIEDLNAYDYAGDGDTLPAASEAPVEQQFAIGAGRSAAAMETARRVVAKYGPGALRDTRPRTTAQSARSPARASAAKRPAASPATPAPSGSP